MEVIGFDLYMELLKESLAEIQGQDIPIVEETQVDLAVTAFIPGDYIIDNDEKLSAYRMASDCKNQMELVRIAANLVDRYGPLPKAVESLLNVMKLKLIAKRCGFTRIKLEKPNIILETTMDEPAFKLLRNGLAKHLQSRLIFVKKDRYASVIARGLGVLPNDNQIDQLCEWLCNMEREVNSQN
tara:strand:- start:184 stop:735 length:552 start_codon:yes stop_codon:yes gene_type:complete